MSSDAGPGREERSVRRLSGSLLAALALVAPLMTAPTCGRPDLECQADFDSVTLSWPSLAGAVSYEVRRDAGQGLVAIESVDARDYTDRGLASDLVYGYQVHGLDAEGGSVGATTQCSAATGLGGMAGDPGGPEPVSALSCAGANGRVELSWDAASGATAYRVYRLVAGQPAAQVGETAATSHSDLGLENGAAFAYQVVALDDAGSTSPPSAACQAVPVFAAPAGATAPEPVSGVACRGKNTKVNVTWTAQEGAAYYRVLRTRDGQTAQAGEVVNPVYADFGLPPGVESQYQVVAVGDQGAASEPSTSCSFTPAGGSGPTNQPPRFLSVPLTAAVEEAFYLYLAEAVDPDGDDVVFSLDVAPDDMVVDPNSGDVLWVPQTGQLGPNPVEIRASDPDGAFDVQAFVIEVADFNEPPSIVSIPGRLSKVDEPYVYDANGTDPEGGALGWSLLAGAPAGMSIDPVTGVLAWTPQTGQDGNRQIGVRVTDPQGAFATQVFPLETIEDALDLIEPEGSFQVVVGETLALPVSANHPRAVLGARPLPDGATLQDGLFSFTPQPGQEGTLGISFEARFAGLFDSNPVVIEVSRVNEPPSLDLPPLLQVSEGETLRFTPQASDPEGDPLHFAAPGLGLENAFFDEFGPELVFSPSFEQAGEFDVSLSVSDGDLTVQGVVTIQVQDVPPPATSLELVLDEVQSPTFALRQDITGNVTGDAALPPPSAGPPLIVGVSPTAVAQGRQVTVELTGQDIVLEPAKVVADFGAGVSVDELEVLSETRLRVTVSALADAEVGLRRIRVRTGGLEAPSVVAFQVTEGETQLSGQLVDEFTGEPLEDVTVLIQGTGVRATTDADGNFVLSGVPPGPQTLVLAGPNYAVVEIPVSLGANEDVTLDEPLGVRALARPFQPTGDLERAATPASLIDRGASETGGLDFEQARTVVLDSFLMIGGPGVGVVDETGDQLNPDFVAPGFINLMPAGVDLFAERLTRGRVYTLRELSEMLQGTFGWIYPDLTPRNIRTELQMSVDRAWADPANPAYAATLVVFNEGTIITAQGPELTPETRFNDLQAFILFAGFLSTYVFEIEYALDQELAAQGVDVEQLLQQAGLDPDLYARATPAGAGSGAGLLDAFSEVMSGGLMPTAATAQPAGDEPSPPPVGSARLEVNWGARSFEYLKSSGTGAIIGGLMVAGLAVLGGGAAIPAFVAAVATGFVASMLIKMSALLYRSTFDGSDLVPAAPQSVATRTVDLGDSVEVVFQRSPDDFDPGSDPNAPYEPIDPSQAGSGFFADIGEQVGEIDRSRLEYHYHLFNLNSVTDLSLKGKAPLDRRFLPVRNSPSEYKFVVTKDKLREGQNYLRVLAIQLLRSVFAKGSNLGEPERIDLFYTDLGINVPRPGSDNTPALLLDLIYKIGVAGKDPVAQALERQIEQTRFRAIAAGRTPLYDAELIRSQAPVGELDTKLTATSERYAELDTQVKQLDAEVKALTTQNRTRFDAHVDATLQVESYFTDPETKFKAGLELTNPATPQGMAIDAALQQSANPTTARSRLLLYRISRRQYQRARAASRVYSDALDSYRYSRSVLESALSLSGSPRPVPGGGVAVNGTRSFGVETPPSLIKDATNRVVIPTSVTVAEAEALLAQLDELEAATKANLGEVLDERLPALETKLEGDRTNFRKAILGNVEDELAVKAQQLQDARIHHKTVSAEKAALEGEIRTKRLAYVSEFTAREFGAVNQTVNIFGKDVPIRAFDFDATRLLSRNTSSAAKRQILTRVGGRLAGEALGVLPDVAEGLTIARDGLEVLGSPLTSPPVVVTKRNGEIVQGASRGRRLSDIAMQLETRSRYGNPVLPEAPSRLPALAYGWDAGAGPTPGPRGARPGAAFGADAVAPAQFGGGFGFAPGFEMDPGLYKHLGVLQPFPDGNNPKGGFLVRYYPFYDLPPQGVSAGFPSDLIAVDSEGRIYLENRNSDVQFGGRIFRFEGRPAIREHVGATTYFNLNIQFARPAEPIAMEVGDVLHPDFGLVETVYVANKDSSVFLGGGTPTNRILRVETFRGDFPGPYEGGQNRNRLVGQPFAEHEDFRFTGPSDLEVDARAPSTFLSGQRPLYFSDLDSIYMIRDDDADLVAEVEKLVEIPGLVFSGLAVDSNGNLFFADWSRGEVFVMEESLVQAISTGFAPPISSRDDLDERCYLIKVGLDSPTDIELDQWERRYLVSTPERILAFDIPVTGRLDSELLDVRLDVIERELDVTRRIDRGNVFIAGTNSEGAFGSDLRIRIRKRDPDTGAAYWESRAATTSRFGATILDDLL